MVAAAASADLTLQVKWEGEQLQWGRCLLVTWQLPRTLKLIRPQGNTLECISIQNGTLAVCTIMNFSIFISLPQIKKKQFKVKLKLHF